MNKYLDHGYTISQLLDRGVDKSLMSKKDSANVTTRNRPKEICNVDYIMSSDS